MRPTGEAEPTLTCPGCGSRAGAAERFCADCGLPLVLGDGTGEEPSPGADVSERRRRARLVKPQLAEGPLVKVAWVRNQAEGEFMQSLLLEHGVPSLLRRTAGFDVPDMLFAGPRDVLVAASGVQTASEILLDAGLTGPGPGMGSPAPVVRPWRLLAWLLVALIVGGAVIWALSLVVHGRTPARHPSGSGGGKPAEVQAPLRVDRVDAGAERPLDGGDGAAAVRSGGERDRRLLALVVGQEVEHRSAEQRRVAEPRGERRPAALTQAARDRRPGVRGLPGEPTTGALQMPRPAQLAPPLDERADDDRAAADVPRALRERAAGVQSRGTQPQHLT
jgi:hypothetical protein